jgi:hypothetical protein
LVTVNVYTSGVPSVTGFGVAVFTMATSALEELATSTVALAVLLVSPGTRFVAVAVAVSVMLVPEGVPEFTCSTTVKLAFDPDPKLAPSLHVIVPVPPTEGLVGQVHPVGIVMDWNVVFGGVVSVKLAPVAAAGPLFVTCCV